jgi:hypothetical protein
MLDTHKLPPGESSRGIIESPLSSQNAKLSTGAEKFYLDIPSSLVVDPDSCGNVFKSLKIRVIQHILGDFEC